MAAEQLAIGQSAAGQHRVSHGRTTDSGLTTNDSIGSTWLAAGKQVLDQMVMDQLVVGRPLTKQPAVKRLTAGQMHGHKNCWARDNVGNGARNKTGNTTCIIDCLFLECT